MPQRRRNPALLFLLVPLIGICSCGGCCAWAFGSPIVPLVMGQSALIFFGRQQTEGTIDALEPCQSGVTLGSTPNGFDLRIGDSTAKTYTVRVRYDDASGAQISQTIACTEFDNSAAVGDHVAVRFRPDVPGDILLEKDRGLYQTFAMSAWGSIVLLVALLVAPIRRPTASGGHASHSDITGCSGAKSRHEWRAANVCAVASRRCRPVKLRDQRDTSQGSADAAASAPDIRQTN